MHGLDLRLEFMATAGKRRSQEMGAVLAEARFLVLQGQPVVRRIAVAEQIVQKSGILAFPWCRGGLCRWSNPIGGKFPAAEGAGQLPFFRAKERISGKRFLYFGGKAALGTGKGVAWMVFSREAGHKDSKKLGKGTVVCLGKALRSHP